MSRLDPMLQAELDARLSRLILRAARHDAPVQDVIDATDLARAAGHDAIAARLAGVARLRMGAGAAVRTGFSVDLGIAELKDLMPLAPQLAFDEIRFPAPDAGPHQRPPHDPAGLAQLTARTDALLGALPALMKQGGLADALGALAEDVLAFPPVPANEHVAADPEILASLFGLQEVRRFLIGNGALLRATSEGDPLLEAAARLGPSALGPYFCNVRRLIRNARDIFALIDAAGDRPSRETVETWCVLLSPHLGHHQQVELADELGDRGMTVALTHILAWAARADAPHYPVDPVWRIRDVCLDIDEWDVAADAQLLIALWRGRDANEWRILTEIRAEMGDSIGVGGALERALLMCPEDPATQKRMAAWKTGVMPPSMGGYGTLPGRRRVRRARLAAYRAIG